MKAWLRFMDWPLRAKMVALLVVASLLPLGVAAFIDIREAWERLLANTATLLAARGDQLVRELDAFHRSYQRSVDNLARLPAVVDFCQAHPANIARLRPALQAVLAAHLASDANLRGVAILDVSGTVKIATEDQLIGLDLSYHSYVRAALRGAAVISDIHLAEPQVNYAPTIAYLAPVLGPARKMIGLAAFWVHAISLWDVAKASNALAGPGSFAVLFDHQGIRIAHTYSKDIVFHPGGRLDPATVEALVAERRFGEETRGLLEDVRAFPEQFDRALSEAPDPGVFRGLAPVNQRWNYGVGRRFQTTPWTVFYMIPEEALNVQIAQMTRKKIIFASVISLIALIAGTLFAAGILKPIRSLSQATAAIAGGDLAARVQAGHADELGRLGTSFNSMAARIEAQATALKKGRDELDLRVQERTAELLQTTKSLEVEIAERKRAEEAMRESQRLLQAIIDNSTAVIYVKDLQGRYLLINRRYSELFHISNEAIVGKTDRELFPREAADAFRAMDQRVLAAGAPLTAEEVAPHDDGPHTYLSVKCPLWDNTGKPYAVFGISTDITERKRAEETLRASEERTQLIIETALDAVVTIDSAGVITGWSPQAETTFGWTRQEARGRSLAETIIPQRYREAHRRGIHRYLATGEAVVLNKRIELTTLHRDGHEFPVELSITPIRIGGTVAFNAFVRDITERKRSEEALRQSQKMEALGTLAGGIAHDFNYTLTVIMGNTHLAIADLPPDHPVQHYLAEIDTAGARAVDLVRRILTFSRHQEAHRTAVKFQPVVEEALQLLRAALPAMIHLRTHFPADLPDVAVDATQIHQILMNLGTNAAHAMGDGGGVLDLRLDAVSVDADLAGLAAELREGRYVRLSVSDSGCGMDKATLQRIFEPFFTTKAPGQGTGLGLAVVHGIIKSHEGAMTVYSQPGKGTTFHLYFPAAEAAATETQPLPREVVRGHGEHVLYVDD